VSQKNAKMKTEDKLKRTAPQKATGMSIGETPRPAEFRVFVQFHGAMLLIHCPLLIRSHGPGSTGPVQDDALELLIRRSVDYCIESACAVLKAADIFVADNTVLEKRVSYLIVTSISVAIDLKPRLTGGNPQGYCPNPAPVAVCYQFLSCQWIP
jgi:hypothetical protein